MKKENVILLVTGIVVVLGGGITAFVLYNKSKEEDEKQIALVQSKLNALQRKQYQSQITPTTPPKEKKKILGGLLKNVDWSKVATAVGKGAGAYAGAKTPTPAKT